MIIGHQLTVALYLAHLNPLTKSHLEIINELKNRSDHVQVMPVIAKGSTDVTASTSGGSDSEPIRVPTHSTIVITLLALAMLIVASRRIQRPLNRE